MRHRLTVVLAIALAAPLAGARSFTAIAQWAAEAPGPVFDTAGIGAAGTVGVDDPACTATSAR
uniref:hypothetical protein n=1 Tax=Nocardia higoensis TaxID=228599 RepID=UPI001FE1EA35|nr:hypothetical protein [Nocardia higoensis]